MTGDLGTSFSGGSLLGSPPSGVSAGRSKDPLGTNSSTTVVVPLLFAASSFPASASLSLSAFRVPVPELMRDRRKLFPPDCRVEPLKPVS